MKDQNRCLIADASHPLISNQTLLDETLLYNLDADAILALYEKFKSLTGLSLYASYPINTLSGGQKVILMTYLCLLSPAQRINFRNLEHALDQDKLKIIQSDIRISSKTKTLDSTE